MEENIKECTSSRGSEAWAEVEEMLHFMADNMKTGMQRQKAQTTETKHVKMILNEQAWMNGARQNKSEIMRKLNYIYCVVSVFQWLFSTCVWNHPIGQLRSKNSIQTCIRTVKTEIEGGHGGAAKVVSKSGAISPMTCQGSIMSGVIGCNRAHWSQSHLTLHGWVV